MTELKERTYWRSIALQCLYEYDQTGHNILDIMHNRFEAVELEDEGKIFVIQLVNGILENREKIDAMITKYAADWPIEQIALIDCNIIRIAAYEFAVSGMTPQKVAINESVELAKAFGSETAPKFVNGVLGSIADNLTEGLS